MRKPLAATRIEDYSPGFRVYKRAIVAREARRAWHFRRLQRRSFRSL